MRNFIFYSILIISSFSGITCKNRDYGNPVDMSVGLTAPTALEIVAITEANADLKWKAPPPDPDYPNAPFQVMIERSSDSISYTVVDSVAANVLRKAIVGIYKADTTYSFRIWVKSGSNRSSYSNVATAQFVFSPPSELTVISMNETAALLQWKDNSTNEKNFIIERSSDGANYTVIDSVGANITTKIVGGVYHAGLIYSYRLQARSLFNISSYSNIASSNLNFPAPSVLSVTTIAENSTILQWVDNSAFETNFVIEQSSDGINYSIVDSVGANVTIIEISSIYQAGITYSFRVRAKSLFNISTYSNVAVANYTFVAPSALSVTSISEFLISLQWVDNSTIETGFLIEQSSDMTNYIMVDSVNANITTKAVSGIYNSDNTYYFRVRAKSVYQKSAYSNIASAQGIKKNAPPTVPTNPIPANTATSVPTDETLKWSCSDPDGDLITYDVFFGTASTPTTQISTGQTAAMLPLAGLLTNTTYYWKVHVKDSKGSMTSGPVWSFTTIVPANNPPSIPTNPVPANAATGISTSPTLSWGCSDPDGDAITYDVFFGTTSNPSTQVATGQSGATLSRTGLSNSTTYYWKVNAKDSKGAITTGAIWSFTTVAPVNNPPTIPANPSPVNAATGISTSPTLSWNCSDPDGDVITYDVFWGTTNNPTTQVATGQSATTLSRTGLLNTTMYYWRVRAKDIKGAITMGPVWSFTTIVPVNNPPAIPTNPTPANSATGVSTSPTLSWNCSDPDGDVITYDVFFGTSSNPTTQVVTGQSGLTLSRNGLLKNTTYYWRINAKDSKGATTIGVVWRFTTGQSTIGLSMVSVAGGTFQMGSITGDQIEQPVHLVTVSSFSIDAYEVTFENWTDVGKWAESHGYSLTGGGYGSPSDTNQPVIAINWYDVVTWCNARSEKDGLTPVYYTDKTLSTIYRGGELDLDAGSVNWTANGYRLPTEAEWEFAARGGTKTHNYTYSGSNSLDEVGWDITNSGNIPHPVGKKSANELGIFDMSGNAWEWCWDFYGGYSSGTQTDPTGATRGIYRVIRGGAYGQEDAACHVTNRAYYQSPNWRNGFGGVRCVRR